MAMEADTFFDFDRDLPQQFTSLLAHLTYSFGKCHSWLTPFLTFKTMCDHKSF